MNVALLIHPILYSTILGIIVALYLSWVLARQQYLGTHPQFYLFSISIISLVAGVLGSKIIVDHLWTSTITWPILSHPSASHLLLAGISLVFLGGGLYLRRIHYPFWRVMDMNGLALAIVILSWMIGQLVARPIMEWGIVTLVWLVVLLILLVQYHLWHKPGLSMGLLLIGLFSLSLGIHFVPAWHHAGTSVEYITDGVGVMTGIVWSIYALIKWKTPPALAQLPQGVSQGFKDTFNKSLAAHWHPYKKPDQRPLS